MICVSEKMELVVNTKKVKEENTMLQKEIKRLTSDQTRLQQSGLSFILETKLSATQLEEIREIASGERGSEGGPCLSSEMRELKRKLDDKSEQLRMLQGFSIFCLDGTHYTMIIWNVCLTFVFIFNLLFIQ